MIMSLVISSLINNFDPVVSMQCSLVIQSTGRSIFIFNHVICVFQVLLCHVIDQTHILCKSSTQMV